MQSLRVVFGLLLVCAMAMPGRVPSFLQPLRASADDTSLRQQILQLYPGPFPETPHPWFNPPSAAKLALGEALFYDPNLSRCGTIACASCHQPTHGYASPYQVPSGCDGVQGRRRAPTLYHVAYQSHYFWDGRVQSLEQQALFPVMTAAEMGNAWDVVLTYLMTGRHAQTNSNSRSPINLLQSKGNQILSFVNALGFSGCFFPWQRCLERWESLIDPRLPRIYVITPGEGKLRELLADEQNISAGSHLLRRVLRRRVQRRDHASHRDPGAGGV